MVMHGSREIFSAVDYRLDYRPRAGSGKKIIDGSRSVHAVTECIGALV